ncbi:MAG TPA: hypothetical protein PKE21_05405 [Flavobacteriales bacterium]|nr:hypothetical protein [Flavobacteriales bacterium]HMR26897.1 hypothetical protein [Flavobacteriales bacterium]
MEPLPLRHSVTEAQDAWDTGMRPILVVGDDLRAYVAKHGGGQRVCSRLVNELLAHHYARIWGLPVLEAALMRVDPAHVGRFVANDRQPAYFKTTCWATAFRSDSVELNRFLRTTNPYERRHYPNKADLLRIALFDIWLANEDRTQNNPNILVTTDPEGFTFRVMDHEAIFGTNVLDHPLPLLTMGDSLLAHPVMPALLGVSFSRDSGLIAHAEQDAYLWVHECEQRTDEILSRLPADWGIDVATLRQRLQDRLFDPPRLPAVLVHFHALLAQC